MKETHKTPGIIATTVDSFRGIFYVNLRSKIGLLVESA